jgi:hypothetical protein
MVRESCQGIKDGVEVEGCYEEMYVVWRGQASIEVKIITGEAGRFCCMGEGVELCRSYSGHDRDELEKQNTSE